MEKKFIIITCLVFLSISVISQEYKYIPFPDSNCIWSEKYTHAWNSGLQPTFYTYALFDEDTIINSIVYNQLFLLYDTVIAKDNATYIGAIREDSSHRIFFLGDGHFCGIGTQPNENGEIILYDFSADVGDTIRNALFALPDEYLIVKEIDTVEYPSGARRVFHFEPIWWTHWIEGIGNERGLLYYSGDRPFDGTYSDLICCKINDTLAFLHTDYSDCYDFDTSVQGGKEITGPGVYPNPVISESQLELSNTFDILEIYNINGSMILQSQVSGMDYYTINSIHFNQGIYWYRIFSLKGLFRSGRFVVN